jgi:hypothetical protein
MLCAYGKYVDDMVILEMKNSDFDGVRGASGVWRIKDRTVTFTQRIGDEKIMKEH